MLSLSTVAWTLPHFKQNQNGRYNLQDDVKGSFVWVSEKLIFKVKGDGERACFSSALVHWGETSTDHVTVGVKSSAQGLDTGVMTPEATGLLLTLSFQNITSPIHLHWNKKFKVLRKFSHILKYFFVALSRQWYRPTYPSIYIYFFLFLVIVSVGVHLSEWNTDRKLGQYSLQLRQKQLSFKSPPHPHFPGVCHWKPSPQNTAALPQPAAVCLRPALTG